MLLTVANIFIARDLVMVVNAVLTVGKVGVHL